MSDSAISVQSIGKQYRLGGRRSGYRTLRDALASRASGLVRAVEAGVGRNEALLNSDALIWALRDVSFDLPRGEAVGIIGPNGAGKSTLLKILARVTEPTIGCAAIHGRVGSLLEVGTGFHPELTGRENIFLNGAILGMRRSEIGRNFDQIVAFAEVERFIDTPVKRYSSGMYLRLAFAVAAHLESEILLVDEVLAVGDASFQRKCLGKMNTVAQQGRTVLFVSHNLDAIQRLCSRTLLFERGQLAASGNTRIVVRDYLAAHADRVGPDTLVDLSTVDRRGTGEARFTGAQYTSGDQAVAGYAYPGGPLEFSLTIVSDTPRSVRSMAVCLKTQSGTRLVNADTVSRGDALYLKEGRNHVRLRIDQVHLNPGIYLVDLWLGDVRGVGFDAVDSAFEIEVVNTESSGLGVSPVEMGAVHCRFSLLPDAPDVATMGEAQSEADSYGG